MELQFKPNFEMAMRRIEAWFQHDIIDRPPVSFHATTPSIRLRANWRAEWPDLKARWFDAEYQVDKFIESLRGSAFHGETFPVFWPNLGRMFMRHFMVQSWNTAKLLRG